MIRRGTATAAAIAVAVTTLTVATGDAGAWTDGACTTTSGVTVVIDFQELGGGVHVRCAPQPVGNGFEALRQAGIDHTTTVRFPGFLCRIAGKPANDPCQTTSPATAYWSYWIAQRGASWCYSSWGAGNRTPPPGTVEGWSFSLGRTSSTAPAPRVPAPAPLPGSTPPPLSAGDCDRRVDTPAPAPTTTPPPAPSATTAPTVDPSGAPAMDGVGGVAGGAAPGRLPSGGPPVAVGRDGPGGDATPTTDPTQGADDPRADGNTDRDPDHGTGRGAQDDPDAGRTGPSDEEAASVDLGRASDRSDSPAGVVLAVVLVAALTGGAVLIRRRSRAAHAP
jgi:hypothetical protein